MREIEREFFGGVIENSNPVCHLGFVQWIMGVHSFFGSKIAYTHVKSMDCGYEGFAIFAMDVM